MPSDEKLPPPYEEKPLKEKAEISVDESGVDENTLQEACEKRKRFREYCLFMVTLLTVPLIFASIVWYNEFLHGWFHEHRWMRDICLWGEFISVFGSPFKPRAVYVAQIIAVSLMMGCIVAE